jgi:hypothetical protein
MTDNITLPRATVQQALEAHRMLRNWIEAVPQEVVLPAMPGIDGDWLDEVEIKLRTALAQQAEPVHAGLTLAVIGNKHFGNPIPPQWYAAAKELIASPDLPQQQAKSNRWVIDKVDGKLSLNGAEIGPGTIEVKLDGLTYRSFEKVEVRQQAEPVSLEHVTDGSKCWCDPELDYKDPDTGVEVWVHRSKQ